MHAGLSELTESDWAGGASHCKGSRPHRQKPPAREARVGPRGTQRTTRVEPRRGSGSQPAGRPRAVRAPPAAPSPPARSRAALWELWSSRPRGAQRGVGIGGASARLPLRLPRRGPSSGGAVAQRRGQGASARPRPRAAESPRPQQPPPPTARRAQVSGVSRGYRAGGLRGPASLATPGGRRRWPGGCRPAAEDAVGRRRPPAPRIPAGPRGPGARRSLRAERLRHCCVSSQSRASSSISPVPHRGPLPRVNSSPPPAPASP